MAAFPVHTIEWKTEEQTAWRRFSLSLPWYGFVCGVALHAYRWVALSAFVPRALGVILAEVALGVALMCALTAGHLANFTLRSWRWRAPALGAFIAAGESAMALALTVLRLERLGRADATLADWPSSVLKIFGSRVLVVSLFALILSAVVVALRKTGLETQERVARTE